MTKKIYSFVFKIFYFFAFIFLFWYFSTFCYADNISKGQVSTGYSYIDLDNEHLNFIPYLNFNWNFKNKSFELYTSNEGYYLLNSILNEKFNLNVNFYLNKINKLYFGFYYEDYNFPQFDSTISPYNQFLINVGYSNFSKNVFSFKNESKYLLNIDSQDTIYDSLSFCYIIPSLNANYYTYLKLNYESDSNFNNIYTDIYFDLNGLFFVKNNQIFNLGFKGEGGYSLGKSKGNYFDIDYYNKISSILTPSFSYSTEFDFRYKYFIKIVDTSNEINFYAFSQKFTLFYTLNSFDISVSNKFNFFFFPDSTVSNYFEYILYFKLITILSKSFILNGETSLDYSAYYLNSSENSFLININLGILFDNKKDFSLLFNNKFEMNFEQDNNFTTNETGFNLKYKAISTFYLIGNLNYKITYNSSTNSGQQYFFTYIGVRYDF